MSGEQRKLSLEYQQSGVGGLERVSVILISQKTEQLQAHQKKEAGREAGFSHPAFSLKPAVQAGRR